MANSVHQSFARWWKAPIGDGFPFFPAKIRIVSRRVHAIESDSFAWRVPEARHTQAGLQQTENERLRCQGYSNTAGITVRVWDLPVPRMGRRYAGIIRSATEGTHLLLSVQ